MFIRNIPAQGPTYNNCLTVILIQDSNWILLAATLFLQPLGSLSFHCILKQNVVVWSKGTWLDFILKGYLSQTSLRTTDLQDKPFLDSLSVRLNDLLEDVRCHTPHDDTLPLSYTPTSNKC